mgnify:CR=1 FL=1
MSRKKLAQLKNRRDGFLIKEREEDEQIRLNKRDKNDIIWISLAIIIITSVIYQQLSGKGNPYWEYTKIPVLLFLEYGVR